jgi:GH24 family phage-related lysozyme (muramidase)
MTNEEVQAALNSLGFGPLKVDGKFGNHTKEAVKRFQRAKHLMPDGIVGNKTIAALSSSLSAFGSPGVVNPAAVPVATPDLPAATGTFPMSISDDGMRMLAASEGMRTHAYLDSVGVLTIGIGSTWASQSFRDWWEINRPGKKFSINSTITEDEAYEVARLSINEEYATAVNDALGHSVPQPCFDAAVHFIYNVGTHGVKWAWLPPFKAGDYAESADILETHYLKPPEIKSRREREAELMRSGKYYFG